MPNTFLGENFKPKVTIIIPVYNGSVYMREAIDSALDQTYDNIEILVVNDGSNDEGKSEAIALSYGDKIRYFSKPNGGVATALNLAIKEMNGEYFSWLSHDDVYFPEKVEKQINFLKQIDRKDIVLYSDYVFIDATGREKRRMILPTAALNERPLYSVLRAAISGCSLLIPREAFEKVGVFDPALRTTQDYDLWFRMQVEGKFRFVHQPEVLIKSRSHDQQVTHRNSSVVPENDVMWVDFYNRMSEEDILSCASNKFLFLQGMADFLGRTPYAGAAEFFRKEMAKEHERINSNISPVLSICIPTFNRAQLLESALYSLKPQIIECGKLVELIVSDNGSTDDTEAVVQKAKLLMPIAYHKQGKNIGPEKNALYCVENLAQGEFCWIIGDDDFARFGAVKKILDVLSKNPEVDFVFANVTHISYQEFVNYKQPVVGGDLPENIESTNKQLQETVLDRWEMLIHPAVSDEYMGFWQSNIFRRSIWLSNTKVLNLTRENEAPSKLDISYPHVKILAHGMIGRKAYYIGTPLLTVMDRHREAKDAQPISVIARMNELLDLYESLGVDKEQLRICREHTLRLCGSGVIQLLIQNGVPREYEDGMLEAFFKRFGGSPVFVNSLLRSILSTYNEKTTIYRNFQTDITAKKPESDKNSVEKPYYPYYPY